MRWIEAHAPAKINLFLELLRRRPDGFHEIDTVMTSVSLFDSILISERSDDQISISQIPTASHVHPDLFSMPLNPSNLICKAIDALRDCARQSFGLNVMVRKIIPAQAGMAGGSSDAATTLLAVNRFKSLGLSVEKLAELAGNLGSDVAFFLKSNVARCLGRGERIHRLNMRSNLHFVIAMPPIGLSTAEVYMASRVPEQPTDSQHLIREILAGNPQEIALAMHNRLQVAAGELSPWIARLAQQFSRTNCLGHQMTGSGSGYFGIFASRRCALIQKKRLAARMPECCWFFASSINNREPLIRHRSAPGP